MSKKVTKLIGLSLVLVLLSILVLVLSASGNDDEALSDGYEVIWQGDDEPDANLKVELMMQAFEKQFYQVRDPLVNNQITNEALLVLEEQWETQINLAKDALIENGIGEVELRKWEERQKEKLQAWKEPLIIIEDTE